MAWQLDPAITPTTPSAPELTVGTYLVLKGDGTPDPDVVISFRLSEPPTDDPGNISYSRDEFEETSDNDGLLDHEFLKNAVYVGRRGQGPEVPFSTGDEDTFTIPNIPSRPEPL